MSFLERDICIICGFFLCVLLLSPTSLLAAQSQPPGDCELGINHQSKSCNQRCTCGGGTCGYTCDPSQRYYGNDLACARSRVGIPTYSAKATIFSDADCGGKACNHAIAGIAHRTFPMGCLVEVANLDRPDLLPAVAVVMDRGPNVCFPGRTVDGNLKLKRDIGLTGSNRVSYKLLSCPGMTEKSEPSGPALPSLEALIEAQKRGDFASGFNVPQTYTAVNTPWGPGYLGTPPPVGSGAYGSPFANASPIPIQSQQQTGTYAGGSGTPTAASQAARGGAAVGILVQPHAVVRGKNVHVSWTSVNAGSGCTVYLNDKEWEKGAEGAKSLKTVSSDPATLVFELRCPDATGSVQKASDSATLQ